MFLLGKNGTDGSIALSLQPVNRFEGAMVVLALRVVEADVAVAPHLAAVVVLVGDRLEAATLESD